MDDGQCDLCEWRDEDVDCVDWRDEYAMAYLFVCR